MFFFSIRKISIDSRALINVLRQEKNWSSQRLLRKFSGKNWAGTSADRLLKKINFTAVTERPISSHVGISEIIELVEELICSHESALHVYKNPYENWKEDEHFTVAFRRIAKHDLRLKVHK